MLSQWINIGGIGFSLVEANAITSAFIVELAIIIYFLDFQQIAPLPKVKI